MLLKDLAYARSGDKGDTSNIGVLAFNEKFYNFLVDYLSPDRIREHFKEMVKGEIIVYPMPNLLALNVVMKQALGGGATKTLRYDQTGKAMASALLKLEIKGYEQNE
jgi:hypothetical protein